MILGQMNKFRIKMFKRPNAKCISEQFKGRSMIRLVEQILVKKCSTDLMLKCKSEQFRSVKQILDKKCSTDLMLKFMSEQF